MNVLLVNINATMFWEVLNFFILLFLLRRFLYTPIKDMLDSRAAQINGDLDEAEKMKSEAADLKAQYEQKLKDARSEAQKIIDNAETRANKRAKNIIKEAEEKAEKVKEKKMEEIEQMRKETMAEMRNKIASFTVLAAGQLIQEQLDEEKHEVMINQFIDELDSDKLGEIK